MNEINTHIVVPHDHPSFAGHFPGQPIVPGVVLLDWICAAIRTASPQPVRVESIVSTKFLQAIGPDAHVDLHITLGPEDAIGRSKARFVASSAAAAVVEGSCLLALVREGNAT